MLPAVWKIISFFLSLGAFLVVGVEELMAGEDPLWIVAKSAGSFVVCWIVMGVLGNVLVGVVGRQGAGSEAEPVSEATDAAERG
jgi:hypothetical protein